MFEIKDGNFIVHTADDEEPNYNRCDNADCEYLCIHSCGAEHGWNGYERTEEIGK